MQREEGRERNELCLVEIAGNTPEVRVLSSIV